MTRRIVAVAVLVAALGAASALAAGVPSPGWQHAGSNRIVSLHADGNQADSGSYDPTISADGRIVAFTSNASLVPEDDNLQSDVYVRDTVAGTTELVSESYGGGVSNEDYKYSYGAVVSGDGRHVAFMSYVRDLTAATSDTVWQQVYVRDLESDTTELITVTPDRRLHRRLLAAALDQRRRPLRGVPEHRGARDRRHRHVHRHLPARP